MACSTNPCVGYASTELNSGSTQSVRAHVYPCPFVCSSFAVTSTNLSSLIDVNLIVDYRWGFFCFFCDMDSVNSLFFVIWWVCIIICRALCWWGQIVYCRVAYIPPSPLELELCVAILSFVLFKWEVRLIISWSFFLTSHLNSLDRYYSGQMCTIVRPPLCGPLYEGPDVSLV